MTKHLKSSRFISHLASSSCTLAASTCTIACSHTAARKGSAFSPPAPPTAALRCTAALLDHQLLYSSHSCSTLLCISPPSPACLRLLQVLHQVSHAAAKQAAAALLRAHTGVRWTWNLGNEADLQAAAVRTGAVQAAVAVAAPPLPTHYACSADLVLAAAAKQGRRPHGGPPLGAGPARRG